LLTTLGRMSVFSLFLELHLPDVIDSNILAAIDELRRLRNRAVHEPKPDISTEDAIECITSVDGAVHLNSLLHQESAVCTKSPCVGNLRKAALHQKPRLQHSSLFVVWCGCGRRS
jgi:hypothetical protein